MVGYAGLIGIIYVAFFRTDYKRLQSEKEAEGFSAQNPAAEQSYIPGVTDDRARIAKF